MRLRSAFLLLLLRTLFQAAYARRTLGTASTGTVVPSTAMAAMLETLQGAQRSLLGMSSSFPAATTDNFMFLTQSIKGPQMTSPDQPSQHSSAAGTGSAAFQAASDPAPEDSRYFQPNAEARQASGMDPGTSDPLIAMQNPGYLMADYQATHNLGASQHQSEDQAMAEYVGSAQGGSDPSQRDLPTPRDLLHNNFRSFRSMPPHHVQAEEEAVASDYHAPPTSHASWDYSSSYDAASQAYPGYDPTVFAAEMAPGSHSPATYHDPWADPDAYLSLISRMHGNDVASGIKEIMDAIMANEDTMKSFIQQSDVDIDPDRGLRRLLEVGSAVQLAQHQAAQSPTPAWLQEGSDSEIYGVPHSEEDQPHQYAAMQQEPAQVAQQNKLFVDTAFLTGGGARSLTPFAKPKQMPHHP